MLLITFCNSVIPDIDPFRRPLKKTFYTYLIKQPLLFGVDVKKFNVFGCFIYKSFNLMWCNKTFALHV